MKSVTSLECPRCSSSDSWRSGKNKQGNQVYRCIQCHFQYAPGSQQAVPLYLKALAAILWAKGFSFNQIHRLFGIGTSTASSWIKHFYPHATEKPATKPKSKITHPKESYTGFDTPGLVAYLTHPQDGLEELPNDFNEPSNPQWWVKQELDLPNGKRVIILIQK